MSMARRWKRSLQRYSQFSENDETQCFNVKESSSVGLAHLSRNARRKEFAFLHRLAVADSGARRWKVTTRPKRTTALSRS